MEIKAFVAGNRASIELVKNLLSNVGSKDKFSAYCFPEAFGAMQTALDLKLISGKVETLENGQCGGNFKATDLYDECVAFLEGNDPLMKSSKPE